VAGSGLAEGLAPLVGLLLSAPLAASIGEYGDVVAAAALVLAAVLVVVPVIWGVQAALLDSGWAVALLPPLLALDNVAAGAGLRALDVPLVPAAIVVGLVSAAIAAAGLLAGAAVRRITKGAAPLGPRSWWARIINCRELRVLPGVVVTLRDLRRRIGSIDCRLR